MMKQPIPYACFVYIAGFWVSYFEVLIGAMMISTVP